MGLAGGLLWRVAFHERRSIDWANPRIAELNLWWWHLALWTCALFCGSVLVLFVLFRKYVDLRGGIATIALLAASWTMFVVSNISSDVTAISQGRYPKLDALSTTATVIDTSLWLAMFFVLFRTVDDVRASMRQK
jgi:hypothetical protein